MNIDDFIKNRQPDWNKLEALEQALSKDSTRVLSRGEIWELGSLYSATISDLSALKSSNVIVDSEHPLIVYLNTLVSRVHGTIYRKPPTRRTSIVEFFGRTFPGTCKNNVSYIAISFSTFFFAGIIGYVLGLYEMGFIELIVPESIIYSVEQGKVWFQDVFTIAPMASTRLMTHNISVTFLIIASGITFGMGPIYLLALNGILIGTVAALCARHGLALEFWSFVIPHAALEVSAILIGGAAGLIIGSALLDPGKYRRLEYLSHRSKEAGILALACVPMLIIAGVIEAFFSPSAVSPIVKIFFGMGLFTCFVAYIIYSILSDSDHDEEM